MALPTIEDVTLELVAELQAHFGSEVNVEFADKDGPPIEVAAASGAPSRVNYVKPYVQVFGPLTPTDSEWQFGFKARERSFISKDTHAFTALDQPSPMLIDFTYRFTGWALSELSITTADHVVHRGIMWLEHHLLLFEWNLLLKSGWDLQQQNPDGYLCEFASKPSRIPGSNSLHAMSATLVVKGVRIAPDDPQVGQLVGTVSLQMGEIVGGQNKVIPGE